MNELYDDDEFQARAKEVVEKLKQQIEELMLMGDEEIGGMDAYLNLEKDDGEIFTDDLSQDDESKLQKLSKALAAQGDIISIEYLTEDDNENGATTITDDPSKEEIEEKRKLSSV